MEVKRSLGVTDNTKHYGCFNKGSNPLETSMFTYFVCSRKRERSLPVNRRKK